MVGSAFAVQVDTETDEISVPQLILDMQQEMIRRNYTARLLKNQMRANMMAARVPQNFMKESMQAVMIDKVRAEFKSQQMEALMIR
ncbi:MAG: hypothetical protein D3910_19575 [Candidatus Electrothrix sp. ATG2]|nr:hypothetical protein [Candidatus Electrothrix sp. ATG2]